MRHEIEQRFRILFRQSAIGVAIIDAKSGRFVQVNQYYQKILGYSEQEFHSLAVSDITHPDDFHPYITGPAARDTEGTGEVLLEKRYVHKNGESKWVDTILIPLFGKDHNLWFQLEIMLDATGHKLAEMRNTLRSQVLEQIAYGAALNGVLENIVLNIEAEHEDLMCLVRVLDPVKNCLTIAAAPSLPDFYKAIVEDLPIGIGISSSGQAAYTKQLVVVEDTLTHPNWINLRDIATRAGIRSSWAQPILNAKGHVLGTFVFYFRTPKTPDLHDAKLIAEYANIAAIALQHNQFMEESKLSSLVFNNFNEAMMVTDENNKILSINPAFMRITGYTLDEVVGRNPRIFSSGRHDPAFFKAMWGKLLADGMWQGEIWDRRKNGEPYPKWLTINTIHNEQGLVHRYIAIFSDISEKKQAEELIWKQANFDALTGLANRNMFRDRLLLEVKKTDRTGLPLALLIIDLDKFKNVNDTLGHDAGDSLLRDVAHRISGCVRETDTVARLGGDEFAVVISNTSACSNIEGIANKIAKVLEKSYQYLDHEINYVSASIGIAKYPTDASNIDLLLKYADQAMYAAKGSGRNQFTFFSQI